jgi:hypothetical protein
VRQEIIVLLVRFGDDGTWKTRKILQYYMILPAHFPTLVLVRKARVYNVLCVLVLARNSLTLALEYFLATFNLLAIKFINPSY